MNFDNIHKNLKRLPHTKRPLREKLHEILDFI